MSDVIKIPGVVPITEADYNAHPAERNSDLGYLLKSPAHYWHHKNSPRKTKDCFEFGTAAHFAILEPTKFYDIYQALPKSCDLRTAIGKAAKAEIVAAGKTPLKHDEYDAIERMIESVYSHPTASKYLTGGVVEHAYFWTDPVTGIACKAKPDYLRTDNVYIDLKTTDDAGPEAFQRSAMKWGYPRQMAYYQDGLKEATKRELAGTILLAVEYEAPYAVGIYAPDDLMIEYGRQQYQRALDILAECRKTNLYPGYDVKTQALSLPGWIK